jgi:hypothetical protein
LFYNEQLPGDTFVLPDDINNAKITDKEVKQVLESHFQANKSTGLSCLPLQCLKWMGTQAHPILADFLNKSAIEQLAPQTWRDSKVVPLYKGDGNLSDCNNYRSIAVSPPFAKLLMSIINQRLTNFADENQLLAPT